MVDGYEMKARTPQLIQLWSVLYESRWLHFSKNGPLTPTPNVIIHIKNSKKDRRLQQKSSMAFYEHTGGCVDFQES